MGVTARFKDNKPYVFINHGGKRMALKYESEEEANFIAQTLRQEIALGRLDLATIRKNRDPLPAAEKDTGGTLKDYYDKVVSPLWSASLSRNTYLSYDGSFRVHILPPLG